MGVNGLWTLLSPAARQVPSEATSSLRLAVDVSIWIAQFIHAMRDSDGMILRNAHLLGFFRRCCKLIFHNIRPVFVFDGQTPTLKRETLRKRANVRRNHELLLKRKAEKLLLNNLKLAHIEAHKNKFYKNKNHENGTKDDHYHKDVNQKSLHQLDDDECLNANNQTSRAKNEMSHESFGHQSQKIQSQLSASQEIPPALPLHRPRSDDDGEDEIVPAQYKAQFQPRKRVSFSGDVTVHLNEKKNSGEKNISTQNYSDSESEIYEDNKHNSCRDEQNEEEYMNHLILPTNPENIDLATLAVMPVRVQLELIQKIKKQVRVANREKWESTMKSAMRLDPKDFSKQQIDSFLVSTRFNKKVSDARRQLGSIGGPAKRIASDPNRQYIFEKQKKNDSNLFPLGGTKAKNEVPVKFGSSWVQKALDKGVNNPRNALFPSEMVSRFRVKEEPKQELTLTFLNTDINKSESESDSHTDVDWEVVTIGKSSQVSIGDTEGAKLNKTASNNFEDEIGISSEDDDIKGESSNHSQPQFAEYDSESLGSSDFSRRLTKESQNSKNNCEMSTALKELCAENFLAQAVNGLKQGYLQSKKEKEHNDGPLGTGKKNVTRKAQDIDSKTYSDQIYLAKKFSLQDSAGPHAEDSTEKTDSNKYPSDHSEMVVSDKDRDLAMALVMSMEGPHACNLKDLERSNASRDYSDASKSDEKLEVSDHIWAGEEDNFDVDSFSNKDPDPIDNSAKVTETENADDDDSEMALAIEMSLKHEALTSIKDESLNLDDECTVKVTGSCGRFKVDNIQISSDEKERTSPNAPRSPGENSFEKLDFVSIENEEHELLDNVFRDEYDEKAKEQVRAEIDAENALLRKEIRLKRAVAETVSGEMYGEIRDLLKLFGLPYFEAKMEAEAQCAFFEQAQLVDGVITEDSDVFLFGARSVYRNFFEGSNLIESYQMKDVEEQLGLDRENLIRMALLLGSDYTEGVRGIGIVNATEVVEAFPSEEDFQEFAAWCKNVKFLEKEPRWELLSESEKAKSKFCWNHRNMKRNWEISENFPDRRVIEAYRSPEVDKSTVPFTWGKINVDGIIAFCWEKFGWNRERTFELLGPVLEAQEARGKMRQSTIYEYFKPIRLAKIRSKRLQNAVSGMVGPEKSAEVMEFGAKDCVKEGEGAAKKKRKTGKRASRKK